MASLAALAPLAALGLLACGGGGHGAREQLTQTFSPRAAITSGRIELLLIVSSQAPPAGSHRRERLALTLAGPFQSNGPGKLPSFAFALTVHGGTGRARDLSAGLTSSSGALYIALAGRTYLAPPSMLSALRQGYAAAAGSGASGLSTLGLRPQAWLVHATAPSASGAAAGSTHVRAGIDVPRFLADVGRLVADAGPLLPAAASAAKTLAGARSSSAERVRVARADVLTGARDHLLRRLVARVVLVPAAGSSGRLSARRILVTLSLAIRAANQAQAIAPPSHPYPSSGLRSALARPGLLGAGQG